MKRLGTLLSNLVFCTFAAAGACALLALLARPFWDQASIAQHEPTGFYGGLLVLDPDFWQSAAHTAWVALAVGAIAWLVALLAIGLGVAESASPRVLKRLASASIAFPPLVTAMGVRALLFRFDAIEGWQRWVALVCVELLWAIPLVCGAAVSAASNTCLQGRDVARLAGGGARAAWARFGLVHSRARPALIRATLYATLLTAAEPAAPLVLGVQQLVAPTIVNQVLFGGAAPSVALEVVLLMGVWLLGRTLLVRGAPVSQELVMLQENAPSHARRVSGPRLFPNVILLLWLALSWLPAWGLFASVDPGMSVSQLRRWFVSDNPVGRMLLTTCTFAVGVATLGLLISLVIAGGTWGKRRLLAVRRLAAVPTLLMGVAILAGYDMVRSVAPAGWSLPAVQPFGSATFAVALMFTWLIIPSLVPQQSSAPQAAYAETCRLLGARGLRSWWLAHGRWSLWLVSMCFAGAILFVACDSGAVLLFTTTFPNCLISPGLMQLDASLTAGQTDAILLALVIQCVAVVAHVTGARQAWFAARPIDYNVRT